jgi:hypothetical protein
LLPWFRKKRQKPNFFSNTNKVTEI